MSTVDQNAAEFIAEAQEVIETFSRTLLELEAQSRTGSTDPDLLNAAFRAIHSLKGLAGLFGATAIGGLSHTLESTLDGLRLGKLGLTRAVLDVLFEAIEVFGRLLTPRDETDEPEPDIEPILARLRALTEQEALDVPQDSLEWVGEAILSVLTEYEEHRLRENIRSGRGLFRVHAKFDILAIDVGIEQLKDKMKLYGEVITYLPSADGSSDDAIELDILLGSKSSLAELSAALAVGDVTVHRLAAPDAASSIITPLPNQKAAAPAPAPSRSAVPSPPAPARPAPAPAPVRRDPEPTPPPRRGQNPASTGRREPPPLPVSQSGPDEPPSEATGSEQSLRSLSQTVRVDLRRLDLLMNLVGELGLVQNNLAGVLEALRQLDRSADVSRELSVQIRDMTRKLALLQQGILDVRMVPIGQVFDKLARVVRKLSRDLDKEIRLVISGAETVLDKLIVEELSDPLMHMIRNCIDHGIEPAAERVRIGKQPAGRIELRAFQKGNRVVIEVEDDGNGIDWLRIRDLAARRNLISPDEAASMAPTEAINLIFAPGFSTREQASEVSGRGVGMDIVKTNIAKLSGMIDVTTEVGKGTKFSITLPVPGDHSGPRHPERRPHLLHPAQLGARVDHGRDPRDQHHRGPRGHHPQQEDPPAAPPLAPVRPPPALQVLPRSPPRLRRRRRPRPAPRRPRRRRAARPARRRHQAARQRRPQRPRHRRRHRARGQPHRPPPRRRPPRRRGRAPGRRRHRRRRPGQQHRPRQPPR